MLRQHENGHTTPQTPPPPRPPRLSRLRRAKSGPQFVWPPTHCNAEPLIGRKLHNGRRRGRQARPRDVGGPRQLPCHTRTAGSMAERCMRCDSCRKARLRLGAVKVMGSQETLAQHKARSDSKQPGKPGRAHSHPRGPPTCFYFLFFPPMRLVPSSWGETQRPTSAQRASDMTSPSAGSGVASVGRKRAEAGRKRDLRRDRQQPHHAGLRGWLGPCPARGVAGRLPPRPQRPQPRGRRQRGGRNFARVRGCGAPITSMESAQDETRLPIGAQAPQTAGELRTPGCELARVTGEVRVTKQVLEAPRDGDVATTPRTPLSRRVGALVSIVEFVIPQHSRVDVSGSYKRG